MWLFNQLSMFSWSSLKEKYLASFIWIIVSFDSSSIVGSLFKLSLFGLSQSNRWRVQMLSSVMDTIEDNIKVESSILLFARKDHVM